MLLNAISFFAILNIMSLRNLARSQIFLGKPSQLFQKFSELMFLGLKTHKSIIINEFIAHFQDEESFEIYVSTPFFEPHTS